MHSAQAQAQARDKLFKSWSGISEVAIIKEVATKGENIDLCMEYWAKKKKITTGEYRHYFYDVVQAYVQRLLSERLVHKADTTLRNVDRDVKCFFFQYACECQDEDLSEYVLDHLRTKEPLLYEQEEPVLAYYWSLVQQLRECPSLLAKLKTQLPRVHIEALMTLPEEALQLLLVELYFANGNESLLPELSKEMVWQHLVDNQRLDQLQRWCCCQEGKEPADTLSPLERGYAAWQVDASMYDYALEQLQQPSETLRNYFARAGYFFPDESSNIPTQLRRLCTMECLGQHAELISRQPLAKYLLDRGHHTLLLMDCVPIAALEQLAGSETHQEALLTLIIDLKTHSLTLHEGFELISKSVQTYLEKTHNESVGPFEEHPLLTFYDFLTQEPSVRSLEGFLTSTSLSRVPYLKSLTSRFDHGPTASPAALPTPHELFLKFRQVNLSVLAAAGHGELVTFSNPRLCQRFARRSQLNYTHYLKQHRGAYAVYYLITEQLQLYGQITKSQLFHACETTTQLALQHAGDEELVTHCVACCEMLGFDTQPLRSFLLLQRNLPKRQQSESYSDLLAKWDRELVQRLEEQPKDFPLDLYQALMRLAMRNIPGNFPGALLQYYASRNDWWHLLLLFQYFDLPLTELKKLLPHFKSTPLGVHLLRALSYESASDRQHKRSSNRPTRRGGVETQTNSSQETMTNSSHSSIQEANVQQQQLQQRHTDQSVCNLLTHCARQDLFAIILCSSNSLPDDEIPTTAKFLELMQGSTPQCSSINLLRHCIREEMPILAVLAATLSRRNLDWCWLVWLAVASGQWSTLLLREDDRFEWVWSVIRGAVAGGHVNALLHSFEIFQPDCKFTHLCRFLQLTGHQEDFSDATIVELRQFFCSWSNDAVTLPLCAPLPRKQMMQRSIGLLLMQLQSNFDCILQQQRFLDCICRSDVGDICDLLDFCLLHKVFGVAATWLWELAIDLEQLVRRDSSEYRRLVDALTEAKAYDEALQLSALLQLPLSDIVYGKWLAELDAGVLRPRQEYEREIEQHALPPAILVNFLLQAATGHQADGLRRYELLQSALGVIKQHHLFPNESFDRDQIEYDMVVCYLQLPVEQLSSLAIYHSEYYEQIMLQERLVLYKSFSELKELAGIDDLSIAGKTRLTAEMEARLDGLLNTLLDRGDIVEALRLQELFEYRPNDLRFIVFAMALAEGITSIGNLSSKERQLLGEIEKSAFPKFNRITLNQNVMTRCGSDLSDSCSDSLALEFEEIPSKEKQQTLDTLLGIGSKLKAGVELGRRIVLAYRAAMYLDKEYLDVLRTKDVHVLLKSAADEDCLQRLLVVSDIQISTKMTPKEIADNLALELATCIVRPRFYIFNANQQPRNALRNADLWGHSIDRDFHLFLELTPNTTLLGNCLLDYCEALKAYRRYQDGKAYEESEPFERLSGIITLYGMPQATPQGGGLSGVPQVLSHKKQNQIYVELLIKAHLCFVHECSMEGIASVLQRAKQLNGQLAKAKSWSLIVRMLIGIARYREMFYCFDSLIENEQFESLLGQFDEDQKSGLRQAILSYLREYQPKNGKELLRLAALHFLMYKELAEMWTEEAQEVVSRVQAMAEFQSNELKCSSEVQNLLQQAMENYTHATENYLLDNKLLLAQQSVSRAELIAVQLDLCSKALERRHNNNSPQLCVSVIGVRSREQFRELVNTQISVPQTLILSRAYGYDINWSEAILSQFVLLQNPNYLQEYLCHRRLSDDVIEQVVKGYLVHAQSNATTAKQEQSLAHLVELLKSVTLKYKLASILGLKPILLSLINDSPVYYLRDTNFGRSEFHTAADT